jgi:hypothetical protein
MKTRGLAALAALSILTITAGATDLRRNFGTELNALQQVREGRDTFRYATFGDEAFWGDTIGLHLALAGAANGGVGPGVSPETALSVGLKVDVEALPRSLQRAIARGRVDLKDPATTIALRELSLLLRYLGRPREATVLDGAFDALCARYGVKPPPIFATIAAEMERRCGRPDVADEAERDALIAHGAAMTLLEAVDFVAEVLGEHVHPAAG